MPVHREGSIDGDTESVSYRTDWRSHTDTERSYVHREGSIDGDTESVTEQNRLEIPY